MERVTTFRTGSNSGFKKKIWVQFGWGTHVTQNHGILQHNSFSFLSWNCMENISMEMLTAAIYMYTYTCICIYTCTNVYIYIYYVYNIYVYLYFFIYICIWPNRSVEGIFQQIWHHIHQNTAHLDHVWSNLSALVLLPLECSRRGGARSRRSNSDAGKMDQTWSGHSPNHPYLATYEKTHDFAELDIC